MATTIKTFDFARGTIQVTRMSLGTGRGVGYQIDQFPKGYLVLSTEELRIFSAYLAALAHEED